MKRIILGQYYPKASAIHRLEPRVKLLLLILYTISLLSIDSYLGYLFIVVFIYLIILTAKIPLRYILQGLKPIIIIALFVVVMNILISSANPIHNIGIIKISYEGIYASVVKSFTLIFLFTGALIFTSTTMPSDIANCISSLIRPLGKLGMPVGEFSIMITIALRFIPILFEEADEILTAQLARGLEYKFRYVFKEPGRYLSILYQLFVKTFKRVDELSTAMESRCYDCRAKRIRLRQISMCLRDYIATFVMILFFILVYFIG